MRIKRAQAVRRELLCGLILLFVLAQPFAARVVAASSDPQTIPIGALVSLSGPESNLGHQAKAGYEIAAEDVNRSGGVFVKELGKKLLLEVLVQDTESNPTKAASRMEYLYTQKKVVAYVGSTVISSASPVAEKNKIPTIGNAQRVLAHERGFKYFFSCLNKTRDQATLVFDLIESIPADKRPRTVGIFQEQTDFAVEQAEFFRKEAVQRGYKVAVFEKYQQLTKDFSPAIMAAKNGGVEVVLGSPVAPDAMMMVRQMKEMDYNPKIVVFLRAVDDLSWGKSMGPTGDYIVLTPGWYHGLKYPGVDKLNAVYQSKFGRPADVQTGPAYASIQILASAIERAGTLDTTRIRDAISATDMMTVTGPVKFRANGTVIDPNPAVLQWLGGNQKLVWPKEFRETSFVYPVPLWKDR